MSEDGEKPEMSSAEADRRREELLAEFCEERGIDPKKIDATQLGIFYETPEMRALLARKYREPRN